MAAVPVSAIEAGAELAGCPIALDSGAALPQLHHRSPGEPGSQYAGEKHPTLGGVKTRTGQRWVEVLGQPEWLHGRGLQTQGGEAGPS